MPLLMRPDNGSLAWYLLTAHKGEMDKIHPVTSTANSSEGVSLSCGKCASTSQGPPRTTLTPARVMLIKVLL